MELAVPLRAPSPSDGIARGPRVHKAHPPEHGFAMYSSRRTNLALKALAPVPLCLALHFLRTSRGHRRRVYSALRHRHVVSAASSTCTESDSQIQDTDFEEFAAFVLEAQAKILSNAEVAESEATKPGSAPAQFLREPWKRDSGGNGPPSTGVTAVLEGGVLWEKAAASVSIIRGKLSKERAESLSSKESGIEYQEGEPYRACALSLVFHARSPLVPTLRGDIRLFEIPRQREQWFGGGADLTPVYLFEEDAREFHIFWREVCRNAVAEDGLGDKIYAEMKRACDQYFFIPARKEHRGVGGIFFDRIRDSSLSGAAGCAGRLVRAVAEGFLPSYMPIVMRRCHGETSGAMREWQLVRRGRYIEFNLLYDRGVRFGLAQLEKVMVSAPPLVRWTYSGAAAAPLPAADSSLLEALRCPREWAFETEEGEQVEFLTENAATVAGVLPRKIVMDQALRFRGVGILVFEDGASDTEPEKVQSILCHQRAKDKSTYPGCWDMLVGGAPRVNETSAQAAARELYEELGISADTTGGCLRPLGIACEVSTGIVQCRCELFAFAAPPGTAAVCLDGEVDSAAWRSVDDVRQSVQSDPSAWVASGLQVWEELEKAGGPDLALQRCRE